MLIQFIYKCCVQIKRARFPLRNDLYCVEWGVKLYSLTQEDKNYVAFYTRQRKI